MLNVINIICNKLDRVTYPHPLDLPIMYTSVLYSLNKNVRHTPLYSEYNSQGGGWIDT